MGGGETPQVKVLRTGYWVTLPKGFLAPPTRSCRWGHVPAPQVPPQHNSLICSSMAWTRWMSYWVTSVMAWPCRPARSTF